MLLGSMKYETTWLSFSYGKSEDGLCLCSLLHGGGSRTGRERSGEELLRLQCPPRFSGAIIWCHLDGERLEHINQPSGPVMPIGTDDSLCGIQVQSTPGV